ncbi:beta-lactamase class C [Muriicola jejuensis]|uniref:Serine hydrolase n=2 Tax=Muriicola jejuensis TaxID=504488 RepID=A0A6P0UK31_9FLAO|nr:serine hydrolase [Muriicola jejuensis]SMP20895.1 beta-lactamase class C [Muriicola jejuensis]
MLPSRALWRSILFLLLLAGLVMSGNNAHPDKEPKKEVAIRYPKNELRDPVEVARYRWQQEELRRAVQVYFEKAVATGDIVGAAVSIVRGDSILLSEGIGESSVGTDRKVDAHTIFRLGSLSKGFTGVLAAKLVEEGKLGWKDKVKEFFPDFRLGTPTNTEQVTFGNLLSHTSGAPYHSFTNLVEAGIPMEQIVGKFREVQPVSKPGSLYSYQNALFAISGEMMEKATGEDLDAALKKRFFDPLGMCSAVMDYETMSAMTNVAMPHIKWKRGWRSRKLNDHYYNALAAGGINASALDMAKWMRFLLGHNPEIMDRMSLESAFSPVVEIKGRSKYYQRWRGHISSHYGYGWRIHKFRELPGEAVKTMWHHGGSVNNFRNEIALYPEDDLGICVLLNSNSRLATHVIPELYQIISEVVRQEPVEMASNYLHE